MNLTAKLIYPQIVQVNFDSQYFLTSTLLRVQEFYESTFDNIREKSFTIQDYMDTYVRKFKKFNYFEKYEGFNFSDIFLKKFLKTQKSLSKSEIRIFLYINFLIDKNWNKKFYVIGTHKNNVKIIDHELAHAFYYLSKDYKNKMDKLIKELPTKNHIKLIKELKEVDYSEGVYNDEIQAYLSTENSGFNYISANTLNEFKSTFQLEKYIH
jgi:hypothetical protein